MIAGVTAVSILWNEGHRARRLISCLVNNFERVVVVVQKSTDDTAEIAEDELRSSDLLIHDEWRGGGDFSMPKALSNVESRWAFVISGDEYPDRKLLDSLSGCVTALESENRSGAFIRFEETIEGQPYVEHGRHVRLFRASGGWEARHHSSASHENTIIWQIGVIHHDRSLNEVIVDYLRKYHMMVNERIVDLLPVQLTMLKRAPTLVAQARGWDFVRAYSWWPEVRRLAFDDNDPEE